MEKHGIENVRGGSFSQIELSEAQQKVIQEMLRGSTDKCFHCGSTQHFVSQCYQSR